MESNLAIVKTQTILIQNEQDIVTVRRAVKEWAVQAQFSLVNQTKLMTAASELARNIYRYAKTGKVLLNLLAENKRIGLQAIFEDKGPGIDDINQAMSDGYSTGGSLGMGLGGTKRLVDEFEIQSSPDKGTCVNIILWK